MRTQSLTRQQRHARVCLAFCLCPLPVLGASSDDGSLDVTINGERYESRAAARDNYAASSVIARSSLVAPGLQAQDVVRTQAGITVTDSGGLGSPSTASIRGASAADTPIYLGGVRLNDDISGTTDLSTIPLWLLHRVEIYRGNSPLESDRMGPGGAIFFEPRRPTKSMGGVGSYGGSWGASRGWTYRGGRYGAVSYLTGIAVERASNRYPFVNDQGMTLTSAERHTELRRNADARSLDGWALARLALGRRHTLDLTTNIYWREQGVPRLALLQSKVARQQTERSLVALTLRGPLVRGQGATFETRLSLLTGQVKFNDPLLELALNSPTLSVANRRIEHHCSVTIDVADWLRIRPTVDLAHEAIDRSPDDIPLGRASRQYVRVAGNLEVGNRDTATLLGFGGIECHHTGATGSGVCDELRATARVGGELHVGDVRLVSNAGRYARAPTLGELYGVSGVVHGNQRLSPEDGTTIDIGIRASVYPGRVVRKLYVDAFFYTRSGDNLVAYGRTGQGFVRPYNVQSARVRGVETLLGSRIGSHFGIEVVGTFMDPRDTSINRQSTNDLLPYRSRLVVAPRIRFDWERASVSGVSGAGAQLAVLYQSSRYADPGGLGVIAAQSSVDLDSYLKWFDGLLTLRGRLADLLDAKRSDIVGYPLPGRSAYLGLEANY